MFVDCRFAALKIDSAGIKITNQAINYHECVNERVRAGLIFHSKAIKHSSGAAIKPRHERRLVQSRKKGPTVYQLN